MGNVTSIHGYQIQYHNGEPMIEDLELAKRLGYAQERDIRKLIKRLLDKGMLKPEQVCATVAQTSEGFQARGENDEWQPTEKGKPFCTVNPYKAPNSDHTGYRVLWYRRVLDGLTRVA